MGAELEKYCFVIIIWTACLFAAVTWEIRIFLQLRVCARSKDEEGGKPSET